MPWIRLSDDYIDDEKILALSDGAFRLWHEGLAYCRRKKTDGLIPFGVMRTFRYFTKSREKQLAAAAREGVAPLWVLIPAMGYKMNQYLKWNLSREEEDDDREGATERMRKLRAKKKAERDGSVTPSQVGGVTPSHHGTCDAVVPERNGIGTGSLHLKEGSGEKTTARSHRPIFSGQRLTIFEWMLDDCTKTLGPHTNAFGLDEWFWELDARAVRDGLVIPKRDGGAWLQAQLVAEAQRRGLPLKMAQADSRPVRDFEAGRIAYEAERDRQVEQVRKLLDAEKGA